MVRETMKLSNIFSRKNRILLRELVVTDFKLRYQGSTLGYAWSVLKPLLLFAILYIVFDRFMNFGRDIEHFPVYLLLGIVLWNFFAEATNLGMQSITSRGDLLRKVNFPRYIIVISGTISSLINLAFNMMVVLVFILINGVHVSWQSLLFIPLIIELYVFALGVAFFLAAFNVKFRDVSHLWEIFMQAAFYATPVIYPVSMVIQRSQRAAEALLLFNPVAQVIQDIRYVLVTPQSVTTWQMTTGWLRIVPFLMIAVVVCAASIYFSKKSKMFAEDI